ncbi:MAG: hypothetical protein H6603_05660 [Flavobacteriales bacterium]|nr:hypothetical protein [Flavobacteriales bacterium]MCB9191632.1 hypothetical protein [Flavobacteriales bacterium]MCB9204446.1 hypothetical protein [Flavobacteriales bacterium]
MASKYSLLLAIVVLAFGRGIAQNAEKDSVALNKAIERAQYYLNSEETEVDLQSLFLYQYVQRKFKLKPISEEKWEQDISTDHIFYPFLRLVDGVEPSVDSTIFSKAGSAIDQVTLRSIYCDRYPLPNSFLDTLKAASEKGKYSLTHALWSLQLIQENGCLKGFQGEKKVADEIARKVSNMVNEASFKNDIAIEGICFLYGMNRTDLINPSWINIIIGHQSSDGGFYRTAKNSMTNSKTTVLALWCMLEYKTGGSVNEPWIH